MNTPEVHNNLNKAEINNKITPLKATTNNYAEKKYISKDLICNYSRDSLMIIVSENKLIYICI